MTLKQAIRVMVTSLMLATLAACGDFHDEGEMSDGALGEVSSDYGQTEQPLTASCATASKFGVNIGASDWSASRCVKDFSSNICAFAPLRAGFSVALSSAGGWMSGAPGQSGNDVLSAGNFARAQINTQFGNWTNVGGESMPFAMNATEGALGTDRVLLYNGAIAGSSSAPALFYKDVVHMACTQSQTLSDSYSAAFIYCSKWAATIDYAKVSAWATFKGVGSTGRQRILKGLILKIYAQGMGFGQRSPAQGALLAEVTNSEISATTEQNVFSSSEFAWGNNYVGFQMNPTIYATHEVLSGVAGKSFVVKDGAGTSHVIAFNSTVDTFSEARARINAVMLPSGLPPTIIAGQASANTLSLKSSGSTLELLAGGSALPYLGFTAGLYGTSNANVTTEDLWAHCIP